MAHNAQLAGQVDRLVTLTTGLNTKVGRHLLSTNMKLTYRTRKIRRTQSKSLESSLYGLLRTKTKSGSTTLKYTSVSKD